MFSFLSIQSRVMDAMVRSRKQISWSERFWCSFVLFFFLFGRVEATKEKRLDGECLLIDQERLRAKNKEKEKREKQRTDGRKEWKDGRENWRKRPTNKDEKKEIDQQNGRCLIRARQQKWRLITTIINRRPSFLFTTRRRILPSFTELYRVVPSCTEFYLGLLHVHPRFAVFGFLF